MAENKAALTVVKYLLATNHAFAEAALVALYAHQTASEQASEQTTENNGEGFSGMDAQFLSSLAVQVKARHALKAGMRLSAKQFGKAFGKLPKYAAQLIRYSAPEKLVALVAKYENEAKAALVETVAVKMAGVVVEDASPIAGYDHPDVRLGNEFGAFEAEQERWAEEAKAAWKMAMEVTA